MTGEIRESFEKWYSDNIDADVSFLRYEVDTEGYEDAYLHESWKAYKAGANQLAAANAHIAELEARCPVSCHKREGKL